MAYWFSNISFAAIALAILVRWLVAQFPYSGHESPPLFGDYEAQRHWMEITTNLPASKWYTNTTDNDLNYWGLDYPPLTAYHMYLLGSVSSKLINSTWTELHKSRGIESYEHKIFMRSTVLISEFLVYTPAIVYYFYKTQTTNKYTSTPSADHKQNVAIYTCMLLFYPAQILIDHGHFQYNSVFLGLTLWAIILILKGRHSLASLMFTLALCYKQMALYYALPFFWFLASVNLRVRPFWKGLRNIILIGIIVIFTFALIFAPYLRSVDTAQQVLKRIFPFNRGLFEDKVANFWFSLSIVYKIRTIFNTNELLKLSTATTLLFSLPAGLHLLVSPTKRTFQYSLVTTSLSFFCFSFQVHEKTILVPALPLILMVREHPIAVNWFVILSTFSLQPLLMRDGQLVPYLVLMVIYTLLSLETLSKFLALSLNKVFSLQNLAVVLYLTSILGCFILSVLAIFVTPPTRYPHFHPTINAVYSGLHFLGFLLFFYYRQFRFTTKLSLTSDQVGIKKTK